MVPCAVNDGVDAVERPLQGLFVVEIGDRRFEREPLQEARPKQE